MSWKALVKQQGALAGRKGRVEEVLPAGRPTASPKHWPTGNRLNLCACTPLRCSRGCKPATPAAQPLLALLMRMWILTMRSHLQKCGQPAGSPPTQLGNQGARSKRHEVKPDAGPAPGWLWSEDAPGSLQALPTPLCTMRVHCMNLSSAVPREEGCTASPSPKGESKPTTTG